MKTSVAEIGPNKVRLTVEIPQQEVDKVLSRTYKRLAGEIRVPGFRPGKAPKAIIDQRLGKDFVRSEALRELLPEFYAEAVRSEALDVVSHPAIDVKTFEDGADLLFEAEVETMPEATLKDYAGLPGKKPKVEVSDADVDAQIERLQTRFASLEVSERPLQDGDFASVDLTTTRHDETIDELTAKDLLLEIGANMVVEELDAELRGKKRGDILKINVTLPERFGERADWLVSMTVLVKETKVRKLPALDDDFAKTVSEFDTLDELKADMRSTLTELQESQAMARLRESVLDAFADQGVEVDLPEGMVELEIDGQITSLAQLLAAQGIPIDRYMELQGLDPQTLRENFREQAERNIKVRLGLDAVVAAEQLQVEDAERDEELERLAQRAGRTVDEVRQMIDEREDWKSFDGDILRAKALDLLVERADITETTADDDDQEKDAE